MQGQNSAKAIKIGTSSIPVESRQNPDSSYGLYSTDELRAKARRVQDAKDKKKKLDAASKRTTVLRNAQLAKRKAEAYSRLVVSLRTSHNLSLRKALEAHKPIGNLQLACQHLGFKIANLPSKAAEIFVSLLVEHDKIMCVRFQYLQEEASSGDTTNDVFATPVSVDVVTTAATEDGKC